MGVMPPTKRTLEKFIQKITEIFRQEGRPISVLDFKEYSRAYVRHVFSMLNRSGLIRRYRGERSNPQFWVPVETGNGYTYGGDGWFYGGRSLLDFLQSLKWDSPPRIHDLKLSFFSKELCDLIFKLSIKLRDFNNFDCGKDRVKTPSFMWGKSSKRTTRVMFYRNGTVQVSVACSENPIPVNEDCLRAFLEHLFDVRRMLIERLNNIVKAASIDVEEFFPTPDVWKITQFHLNRDSERVEMSKLPHITLSEFNHTLRVYYKQTLGRARVECVVNPREMGLKEFLNETIGCWNSPYIREPSYIG